MLEAFKTLMSSRDYTNPLADPFAIEKTRKLMANKYYRQILWHKLEIDEKSCAMCLASKTVKHKPYKDLEFLLIAM